VNYFLYLPCIVQDKKKTISLFTSMLTLDEKSGCAKKKKVGALTGFHAFVMPGQTDRMEEALERKNQRSNTI